MKKLLSYSLLLKISFKNERHEKIPLSYIITIGYM